MEFGEGIVAYFDAGSVLKACVSNLLIDMGDESEGTYKLLAIEGEIVRKILTPLVVKGSSRGTRAWIWP